MALKRWSIHTFDVDGSPAVTKQTLLTAAAEKETLIFSLFLANNSATPATFVIEHTDGTNVLFKFEEVLQQNVSVMAIDSKLVLEPGDEIDVTSDIDDVSILACGDES